LTKLVVDEKGVDEPGINHPTAVHCVGHHFLMLYACAHVVLFPNQRPQSLVWQKD